MSSIEDRDPRPAARGIHARRDGGPGHKDGRCSGLLGDDNVSGEALLVLFSQAGATANRFHQGIIEDVHHLEVRNHLSRQCREDAN